MDIFIYVIKPENGTDLELELEKRRNAFLDVYSLYLETGIPAVKEEAILKAYELHLRDPNFSVIF